MGPIPEGGSGHGPIPEGGSGHSFGQVPEGSSRHGTGPIPEGGSGHGTGPIPEGGSRDGGSEVTSHSGWLLLTSSSVSFMPFDAGDGSMTAAALAALPAHRVRCAYLYIYIYVCMYVYRERERSIYRSIYLFLPFDAGDGAQTGDAALAALSAHSVRCVYIHLSMYLSTYLSICSCHSTLATGRRRRILHWG